jgi:D-ribulokinase
MAGMSHIGRAYEPARGEIAALHESRYAAFRKLQEVGRAIR